jgi:PAS domain-containing protein
MLKDRDFSEMFIQTLEQAIDSVVVIDAENRVIFFNKAAELNCTPKVGHHV